jgi:hypothetical protein
MYVTCFCYIGSSVGWKISPSWLNLHKWKFNTLIVIIH